MKTSTLMTSVMLSASCFAAPVHTARETVAFSGAPTAYSAMRPDAGTVAPPAPEVPVDASPGPQRWEFLSLPKTKRLDQTMAPVVHVQT